MARLTTVLVAALAAAVLAAGCGDDSEPSSVTFLDTTTAPATIETDTTPTTTVPTTTVPPAESPPSTNGTPTVEAPTGGATVPQDTGGGGSSGGATVPRDTGSSGGAPAQQDPDCKPGTGPGFPDRPQCEPLGGPDAREDEGG